MSIIRREQTALKTLTTDQNDPTGFVNITDSTISFSDSSPDRTLTIQPSGVSFDIYVKGKKFTKTSLETKQITAAEGNHYIYYDDNGVLQESVTPSSTQIANLIKNYALITIIYFDDLNNKHIYFAEKRHGIQMDGATHSNLNFTIGTQFLSGSALGNFNADMGSPDDTAAQFSFDLGEIQNEDLVTTCPAVIVTAGVPIYYKLGSAGYFRQIVNSGFSVTTTGTGRLAWNENIAGTWQLTEVNDLDFVLCHIFATNDKDNPYIAIVGQDEYNTIRDARNGAIEEINKLIAAELALVDFVPVGSVIYQTSNTYTNSVKGRVRTTDGGDNYVDFRLSGISPVSDSISSHANLTNKSYDNAGHGTGYNGFLRGATLNSVAPGVTDDDSSGYVPGDLWIDTTADNPYVCLDSTTGAAIWDLLTASLWSRTGTDLSVATAEDSLDFSTASIMVESVSTVQDIVATTGIATVSDMNIRIQSSTAGDSTVTANPAIVAGSSGQILTLFGVDNTKTVTFTDGNGIKLDTGQSITLGLDDNISFKYINTNWVEISRIIVS